MTIQWQNLGGVSYLDDGQLPEILKNIEKHIFVPYDDQATPRGTDPGHNPTIGIGANLRLKSNVALMLDYLGVFAADDARVAVSNPGETEAQKRARYTALVDSFHAVIVASNIEWSGCVGCGGDTRDGVRSSAKW